MRVHPRFRLTLFMCVILFVSINAVPSVVLDNSSLKTISVFFRHGARTPIANLPNTAAFPKMKWFDEPGELTSVGKNQMYNVGLLLRNMYNGFIDQRYKPDEIYVTSTHVDRTFMSAALLLAGLFPPEGHQSWNDNIPWSPIPIWPDENHIDQAKLVNAKNICPRFENEQKVAVQTAQFNFNNNYKDVFRYLALYSGKPINSIFDMFEVWDNLECLEHNGLDIPLWAKSIYPDKLSEIEAKVLRALIVGSKEMVRLTGGPFMKQLHDQFNLVKTKQHVRKVMMHGGHDFSMTAALGALGIFEKVVNPSDTIVLELHETPIGDIVQLLYIDNGGKRVTSHSIPKCGNPCFLNTFLAITKDTIPNNWDLECKTLLFSSVIWCR